jgi:phenylpropionate dioxygenase-like ring-hydroxylating dioxygenase large terminal subunit
MKAPIQDLPRRCTFEPSDWIALADFWHPVCFASEVGPRPRAAVLLDEELVLYRSGGKVVAARDLCLHRGVPLSLGWIDGDEIVCSYHGFRYGADGRCTSVPAQPHLPIPPKLCLRTYLAEERYGVVWVCLSGQPRQPLPEWPELEDSRLKQIQMGPLPWKCTAARHTENFNDIAHLSWVHAGTFGNREKPEVKPYEVEPRPGGLHFEMHYERYSLESRPTSESLEQVHYVYDLAFPFYTRLQIGFPDGHNFVICNLPSPTSVRATTVLFRMTRDFDVDGPDEPTLELQRRVLAEDQPIVEAQRPEELPLDLSEEFHIRADRFSTIYRQALIQLGLGRSFTA